MLVLSIKIGRSVFIADVEMETLDMDSEGNLHLFCTHDNSFHELRMFGVIYIRGVEVQLIGYDRGYVRIGFTGDRSIAIYRDNAKVKYV